MSRAGGWFPLCSRCFLSNCGGFRTLSRADSRVVRIQTISNRLRLNSAIPCARRFVQRTRPEAAHNRKPSRKSPLLLVPFAWSLLSVLAFVVRLVDVGLSIQRQIEAASDLGQSGKSLAQFETVFGRAVALLFLLSDCSVVVGESLAERRFGRIVWCSKSLDISRPSSP